MVTDGPTQASTDQFWQGAAFTPDGVLVASYYDRSYGADNTTGYSDITVSASHDRVTLRAPSGPPPRRCRRRPSSAGSSTATTPASRSPARTAYPLWSDTRTVDEFLCPGTGTPARRPTVCTGSAPNAPFANDQDIYVAGVPHPVGDPLSQLEDARSS